MKKIPAVPMTERERLQKVRDKLRALDDQIMDLEAEKKRLNEAGRELRMSIDGLVPEETVVREIPRGMVKREPKRGVFVRYYHNGARDSFGWIKVRLFKQDGTPGKRITVFYDWQIEA